MACNIPIHSHSHQFIPIPTPIPMMPKIKFPFPHSHSRLANARQLSVNNQSMINVKCEKMEVQKRDKRSTIAHKKRCDVTTFYWIAFASSDSSRPMTILAHINRPSRHFRSNFHVYPSHSHSHFWHICVPISIPWDSHGNPMVMVMEIPFPCTCLKYSNALLLVKRHSVA